MARKIPEGYRHALNTDYSDNLDQRLNLVDLCTCGHLSTDHDRLWPDGPCRKCDCTSFTWTGHVVRKLPSHEPPTSP